MKRMTAVFLVAAMLLVPAVTQAQKAPPVQSSLLHLSRGWNLIAGSSTGVGLDTTFYALNDEIAGYHAVSKDELQDFMAYWVYIDQPLDITVSYSVPEVEQPRELQCRSDREYPCMTKANTAKAIPVAQEQWVFIGNSTSQPLKLANIFYDTHPAPGLTATQGYIARIYDPGTATYQKPLPVLVEYRGHLTQVGDMLRPGEGALVWSPIDYVFLERIQEAP